MPRSNPLGYRRDVEEAVRIFRPVLQDLKIREPADHRPVFFAAYDDLAFLDLDECSVQLAIADIKESSLLLARYTKRGALRVYIVISRNLYMHQGQSNQEERQLRKVVVIHQFVHFLALVYSLAKVSKSDRPKAFLSRLAGNVEMLLPEGLQSLHSVLSSSQMAYIPELTDAHFRLGNEGDTMDYSVLFLNLMFSRQLFEEYFDREKQERFRSLYNAQETRGDAMKLLVETLMLAADDKDIPYKTARSQSLEWVHLYLSNT